MLREGYNSEHHVAFRDFEAESRGKSQLRLGHDHGSDIFLVLGWQNVRNVSLRQVFKHKFYHCIGLAVLQRARVRERLDAVSSQETAYKIQPT